VAKPPPKGSLGKRVAARELKSSHCFHSFAQFVFPAVIQFVYEHQIKWEIPG
jgi:hypothetical protein